MKTLAFIDTETTGVDEKIDRLLEVALVLWSVPHRSVIRSRSWLVKGATENAALAVNGIRPELLVHGYEREDVERQLHAIAQKEADAFVAYNVDFDRKWFSPSLQNVRPWICAQDDFDYPRTGSGKKLVEVALAHGVGVVDAHRALADCMTMARVFERVAEQVLLPLPNKVPGEMSRGSFEEWLAAAARPRATFQAVVSFSDKDKAKALGFRWNDDKHPTMPKTWTKRLAIEDAKKMPFEVRRVA